MLLLLETIDCLILALVRNLWTFALLNINDLRVG